MKLKTMRIVKDKTEKANCLSRLLGDYVIYLERYNYKVFVEVAKHYEILLTKSGNEVVIFSYANQEITELAHCKRGEPHTFDTYFNYYYNIYKVEDLDFGKQYYLGKLKSRVDIGKEYFVLEDREALGYRKLTSQEVEDIANYIKRHNENLKEQIRLTYQAKQLNVIFSEED